MWSGKGGGGAPVVYSQPVALHNNNHLLSFTVRLEHLASLTTQSYELQNRFSPGNQTLSGC